ncbi:SH3 domain-containing protein [Pseudoteredinibacter isoporae]|uniref:SH3 domain-containing protein n=1 Tax=Pseudoteredinibacter isoporae TaxID=570281 RepID=A0A7X0MWB2_9GAMM|nr:SH3 domain-containing protein [Pseudoteredinibacter isoporae]MBB6522288.1 hypothetical protein [Pseudoteredinibacter isoporae]NHO87821.1 hypothetical protein [Pseudoteredinibacter isoporae]NIB23848.1 hypothetical protein [Pseudoteredinibacter isoporae]
MSNDARLNRFFELVTPSKAQPNAPMFQFDVSDGYSPKELEDLLRETGYQSSLTGMLNDKTLTLDSSVRHWRDGNCPFYRNWGELYDTVKQSSSFPNDYCVIDDGRVDGKGSKSARKIEVFLTFRKLLTELADHCDPPKGVSKGRDKLLFFIEKNEVVKKYQFSPVISWEDLSKLQESESVYKAIEELDRAIHLGDCQDIERKSVMRSAFGELVLGCQEESSIFNFALFSVATFKSKYNEHNELFAKRFSVNKILQEISHQDLLYTSKINEIVSSGQTKALTIPAAFVAVSALMKIDSILDGVAIILGLALSIAIVLKSLSVHRKTFIHIGEQIQSEFKRYDNLSEEAEVRRASQKVKEALMKLVEGAKKSLDFIKYVVFCTMLAAAVYVVVDLTCTAHLDDGQPAQPIKNESTPSASKIEPAPPKSKSERSLNVTPSDPNAVIKDLLGKESYRVSTATNLRVRERSSFDSDILAHLPKGALMRVANDPGQLWLQVDVAFKNQKIRGWVYRNHTVVLDFVRFEKLPLH